MTESLDPPLPGAFFRCRSHPWRGCGDEETKKPLRRASEMDGTPAPDGDLNPSDVVDGIDWYDEGATGESGERMDQLNQTQVES